MTNKKGNGAPFAFFIEDLPSERSKNDPINPSNEAKDL